MYGLTQIINYSWRWHPQHLHNNVQGKISFTHLHRRLEPLTHPHFKTARHAAPAGGRFVPFTSHWADAFSRFQPSSSALGSCGALRRAWPHTWPAWYTAQRTCWRRASFVGGIFSISPPSVWTKFAWPCLHCHQGFLCHTSEWQISRW